MKKYPKEKENVNSVSLIRKPKANIFNLFHSPDISHINYDSLFIYDESNSIEHYNKISNKNLIKLNADEIYLLKKIVNEINAQKLLNKEEKLIEILEIYAIQLKKFIPKVIDKNDDLINFLTDYFSSNPHRENISCRKLSKLYEQKKGIKIGNTTVHKVLRKKLGYRFLKTNFKTKKIKNDINKLYCFFL